MTLAGPNLILERSSNKSHQQKTDTLLEKERKFYSPIFQFVQG